jgi:multidrug efflux pump
MDRAKDVRLMIADMENNIISGLILVIIVLFFALGFRNAFLVSLAIPFSMLLSFIILQALGITLNIVVLFSLTLALGMLVDNAIVIIENVYRYMEQGVPRVQAAMKATSEVAYPVIGSTITTLAAFFPMIFWPGIMGEFMKYLPITLIVTLSSSLFVAMVINPALAAIFMRLKKDKHRLPTKLSADEVSASGEKPVEIKGLMLALYTGFLKKALSHRPVVLFISFTLLILLFQVWLLVVGLEKPVEFFPDIDPDSAYVNIDPPEGADLEYIDRIVKKVEMAVNGANGDGEMPALNLYNSSYKHRLHKKAGGEEFYGPSDLGDIEYIYSKAVETSGGVSFESNLPNHIGIQFLDLKDRKRPSAVCLEEIRERVKDIPGARITVAKQEGGPPTGPPINIEISGDDFRVLGKFENRFKEL